ncbi:MAG: riboflavin biosynthesis protein RibF [Bacteroidetes bacterium]|nr:riboflavin biosynthesis protein RibF [Bacteroidota bacterium]
MKIYKSINEFRKGKKVIGTSGIFDGVHLGHLKIIGRVTGLAREEECESVLLTFHPHPRKVLFPSLDTRLLNTVEEKIARIESTGIDHLIIHPFTKPFSRMTPVEFVRDVIVNKLKIKKLILGHNHHFGRNREGSFENLVKIAPLYRFHPEQVPPEKYKNSEISSSKIRKHVQDGNIALVNQLLGYRYTVAGLIIKGENRGASLGFPTANLKITDEEKLIPAKGVYAVKVTLDETTFNGMMNIGSRPTFHGKGSTPLNPAKREIQPEKKTENNIPEVNIFNFSGDIYDKTIRIMFVERLRDETEFENSEALQAQLIKDKECAEKILNDTA